MTKQKADIPYMDGNKVYNGDVKVFESQEKGSNSKLDAVKIIEYYISGYEPEDYTKVTKIKIKPKFLKWITIYHNEEIYEINFADYGPDAYNYDKDKICRKNISKSVVEEIASMIKYDRRSLIIFCNYLRKTKISDDVFAKINTIKLDQIKRYQRELFEKRFGSDDSYKKNKVNKKDKEINKSKQKKKIEEQGKIYKNDRYLIRFIEQDKSDSDNNRYIEKIEYKDTKVGVWTTVWCREHGEHLFLSGDNNWNPEYFSKVKTFWELPCDLYPIIPLIQSDLEALYIYKNYLKYYGKQFLAQQVDSFIEKKKTYRI